MESALDQGQSQSSRGDQSFRLSITMNSAIALGGPVLCRRFSGDRSPKAIKPEPAKFKLPSTSLQLTKGNCTGSLSSAGYLPGFGLRNGSSLVSGLVLPSRIGVSSNDAQFGSFAEDKDIEAPSFFEFITSERVKVVAMLALALALCNADRVVMSVAIVPLSLSNGWSRSFGGIVQVAVFLVNCFAAEQFL